MQFILTNVLLISLGMILYIVLQALPRVQEEPARKQGMWERLIMSEIPERFDKVFNSFSFKFLRRMNVFLLKFENSVSSKLKKMKIENGEKPAIDFKEIQEDKVVIKETQSVR